MHKNKKNALSNTMERKEALKKLNLKNNDECTFWRNNKGQHILEKNSIFSAQKSVRFVVMIENEVRMMLSILPSFPLLIALFCHLRHHLILPVSINHFQYPIIMSK